MNLRENLAHQLQLAITRADSEALARSIAEENISDLEKDKTMKDLEIGELKSRHKLELINAANVVCSVMNWQLLFSVLYSLL